MNFLNTLRAFGTVARGFAEAVPAVSADVALNFALACIAYSVPPELRGAAIGAAERGQS